ncbi:MAG: M35 family metallo-endopeptidase [Rhizobiaceae bacterium]
MNILRDGLVFIAILVAMALMANTANAQGRKFFPPFKIGNSCSFDQRVVLLEAHLNVNRTLDDAVVAVDYERNSREYTTSFGIYDRKRHAIVRTRMNLIRQGTYKVQITVKCETPGPSTTCNMDMNLSPLAYVTKQRGANKGKYIINVCPRFFNLTREVLRVMSSRWNSAATAQGDVFLHEMTHFTWDDSMERAKDKRYENAAVERLAAKQPNKAVNNADSYRIFMMKLAVRNRTVYR